MTLYVLDTDIMGFAFQRHPTVLQRLQHLPDDDLVLPVRPFLRRFRRNGTKPCIER